MIYSVDIFTFQTYIDILRWIYFKEICGLSSGETYMTFLNLTLAKAENLSQQKWRERYHDKMSFYFLNSASYIDSLSQRTHTLKLPALNKFDIFIHYHECHPCQKTTYVQHICSDNNKWFWITITVIVNILVKINHCDYSDLLIQIATFWIKGVKCSLMISSCNYFRRSYIDTK